MMLMMRLRKAREELGLTTRQLGAAIGQDGSAIAHYEAGNKMPMVPALVKLADNLNVSIDWLVGRK